MYKKVISASDAKANLSEVLSSLQRDGPISITRNGRLVATLIPAQEPVKTHRNLDRLAGLFAQGVITSREACEESGASFGDLLEEMSRQGLRLPLSQATRRPAQDSLFEKMLDEAGTS